VKKITRLRDDVYFHFAKRFIPRLLPSTIFFRLPRAAYRKFLNEIIELTDAIIWLQC